MSIEKKGMHRHRGEVCAWCKLSPADAVVSPATYSMSTLCHVSASVGCVSAGGVCADSRRVCNIRTVSVKCTCVSALFKKCTDNGSECVKIREL